MPTSMATARLSLCEDTLFGTHLDGSFGALTGRSVRPAVPVLLTSNGPLSTYINEGWSQVTSEPPLSPAHSEFGSRPRAFAPERANH